MTEAVTVAVACENTLGEAACWDHTALVLWWADILEYKLWRLDPATGEATSWTFPEEVACMAPRAGGGLAIMLRHGLVLSRDDPLDYERLPLAEPEQPDNRFNDGKVGPGGQFWCGSMSASMQGRTGALYRFDPDGSVHKQVDGVGVPNATCFSPDGGTMYWADSMDRVIYAFSHDLGSGVISDRRTFAKVPEIPGRVVVPDGATVDVDGFLWNAVWGAGRVDRYAPDGTLERSITLPVPNPTSVSFGGKDLRTLYITSGRLLMDEAALAAAPASGGLLALRTHIQGVPERVFAG